MKGAHTKRPGERPYREYRLVRVIESNPIALADGDSVQFRIEILRASRSARPYTAYVWRREFYRLQPTFPQVKGKPKHPPADEVILAEESSFSGPGQIWGNSAQSVLRAVLRRLNAIFEAKETKREGATQGKRSRGQSLTIDRSSQGVSH